MLAVGVVVAEREVAEGEFDVAAEAGGARVRSRAFQESRRVGGGVVRGDARGRGRGGVRGLAGEDRRARGDVCVVILGGDGARVEVRRGTGAPPRVGSWVRADETSSSSESSAAPGPSAVCAASTKNASPLRPRRIVKSESTPLTVTVTTFSLPRIRPWYLPKRT